MRLAEVIWKVRQEAPLPVLEEMRESQQRSRGWGRQ